MFHVQHSSRIGSTDTLIDPVEVVRRVKLHLDRPPLALFTNVNLGAERLPECILGSQNRRLARRRPLGGGVDLFQPPNQRLGGAHRQATADRLVARPDLIGCALQPQESAGVPLR